MRRLDKGGKNKEKRSGGEEMQTKMKRGKERKSKNCWIQFHRVHKFSLPFFLFYAAIPYSRFSSLSLDDQVTCGLSPPKSANLNTRKVDVRFPVYDRKAICFKNRTPHIHVPDCTSDPYTCLGHAALVRHVVTASAKASNTLHSPIKTAPVTKVS